MADKNPDDKDAAHALSVFRRILRDAKKGHYTRHAKYTAPSSDTTHAQNDKQIPHSFIA